MIVSVSERKTFSLNEAQELLPLLYRITEVCSKEVRLLVKRSEALKAISPKKSAEIEKQISLIIERWNTKVTKLGVLPKGLWLADFDNGSGYYCWKFPETDIKYCHGYQDGYSARKLIYENCPLPN